MDILNFISWIRGGRVVTTVNPAQTLLPVGLKDNRRDDGYLAGAISVEDLVTQLTPTPTYKVFTALLTQSGGDSLATVTSGVPIVIGVSYLISGNDGNTADFTNIGAPNNDEGTYFIATGTTPNSWGEFENAELTYNTGAPVATVLENTIGDIWFEYIDVGNYSVNSNGLFTLNKTVNTLSQTANISGLSDTPYYAYCNPQSQNLLEIVILDNTLTTLDDLLISKLIEIRVYN